MPWAALFGLVLPSSPRPGAFAPSCAVRVPAFQAPKEDMAAAGATRASGGAGGRRAALGAARERFPALQHKRPRTAAARMLATTAGGGEGQGPGTAARGASAAAPDAPRTRRVRRAPLHESEDGLEPLLLPPALAQWIDRLPQDLLTVIDRIEREEGGRVWLVGGCVRDCLSGLTPWEVDMASTLHPDRVLALFPRALDTGSEHGTVMVRNGGISCEVTTLRAASSDASRIAFGTSLRDDLSLRDLTMNAMAVHVGSAQLFDPWGGQGHVESGTLAAVASAKDRLREDALRTMRVYRFMDSKVGVREPDEELSRALRAAPRLLAEVSPERLWVELRRILAGPRAALVCSRMAHDRVLSAVLHKDVTSDCRGVRALQLLAPQSLPLWADKQPSATVRAPSPGDVPDVRGDVLCEARPPAKPQTYTHIAVVDLEATCDEGRGFGPPEIIELPVVLIKCETGEVVSEFHTFVRPVVNPSLTDFCQELTGITQADVDAAPTFPEALLCLTRWLEDQGFPARATEASEEGGTNASAEASGLLWVCDGDWDLRSMIPRQCVLSDVPQPAFMLRWADLRYASV